MDADAPGVRIVVEENAAYDLYLKKSLKHATLVRPSARGGALELLLDQNLEALAGVREGLDQLAKETPGLRVLKDRFMAIEQAIAMPAKYKTGATYAAELIEELKSSGFIRHTLDLHGQRAAVVARAKIR